MSIQQAKIDIPGGYYVDEGHKYLDDKSLRIPSTTQVLSLLGFVNYDHIREEVLARKSQLGVAVHAALEYLLEGSLDWNSVDETALPYVVGAEAWLKEQNFISLEREVRGICEINGMKFGYQFDNRGTMIYKGRLRHVILDYKTTVASSPTWKWQLAAYSLAAQKLPIGERYLRCILQLKADGTFKPYYYEDRNDELSFQYMLYTVILGLNNGLYSLER